MKSSISCATLLLALTLSACGGDNDPPADPDRVVLAPADPDDGHTHGTEGEGATIGDGTTPTAGGWSLSDVRLPRRAGEPGDVSFRIVDQAGEPLLSYTEEQTKLLHLYVVRNDLQAFRHLHPTLADDGTWTARVNLTTPGSYRVIAEFAPGPDAKGAAAGEAGARHVVLGRSHIVPGSWTPQPVTATSTGREGAVEVVAPDGVTSGPDQQMTFTVRAADGGAPTLGTYLGAYSHLTGFDVETGEFAHAHPSGEPVAGADGTELTFHAEFETPGRYVFFVQVRVDGFVHTVPVSSTVT